MTQDQYGQTRGPGYAVPDDAAPDAIPDEALDENEEYSDGQVKPMTRFQRVASALRGAPERDEQDQTAADQVAAADQPGDYWDEPVASATADRDEAVVETSPDVPVTENVPVTEAGADTAGHPVTQPNMFGTTAHPGNGTTSSARADATIPDVPAGESRPGEAAGALGDFSDLTYGDLLPDAAQYTAQWQQVQFKFVDDPRASVTDAADIIAQVTARLEAAIQERLRAIEERQRAISEQQRSLRDRWGEGTNADTEGLRETLRLYRTFLDQLIGPRAG